MTQPLTPVVGNVLRVQAPFKQLGVLAPPAGTVTFYARDPSHAETVYVYGVDAQVVAETPTTFHVDWPLSIAGEWRFRADAGPGSGMAAGEATLTVQPSAVL